MESLFVFLALLGIGMFAVYGVAYVAGLMNFDSAEGSAAKIK
ncbi:hypothetical protein SPLA5a_PHROGS00130 [Salmonella phage SPLA5a]|nr:hypothetical protein SPLA5a_PHROGS00130 [Salmonella phage SPLA5a]